MNKEVITSKLKNNKITLIFFIILFAYIFIVFRNAFKVEFYVDDYFFLKIGHANDFKSFINFFSPFKDYFYRPIPTELFYFFD
jgi:hypothetical protein